MVAYTCYLYTWEAKVGQLLQVQDQPEYIVSFKLPWTTWDPVSKASTSNEPKQTKK